MCALFLSSESFVAADQSHKLWRTSASVHYVEQPGRLSLIVHAQKVRRARRVDRLGKVISPFTTYNTFVYSKID